MELFNTTLSDIKNKVLELKNSKIMYGTIVMYYSSTNIPSGWALCDGKNGTPDLRNRFIVGAGSNYEVGNVGGVDSVSLTEAQMPEHNHTISINNGGKS